MALPPGGVKEHTWLELGNAETIFSFAVDLTPERELGGVGSQEYIVTRAISQNVPSLASSSPSLESSPL